MSPSRPLWKLLWPSAFSEIAATAFPSDDRRQLCSPARLPADACAEQPLVRGEQFAMDTRLVDPTVDELRCDGPHETATAADEERRTLRNFDKSEIQPPMVCIGHIAGLLVPEFEDGPEMRLYWRICRAPSGRVTPTETYPPGCSLRSSGQSPVTPITTTPDGSSVRVVTIPR